MYGIDFSRPVHLYTDASGFAAGCVVTQFLPPDRADVPDKKSSNELVEVPVIYDSFAFTPSRAKYPTYKRELYAISEFAKEYDYLCKHPYHPAIIHTDHRPLTHFFKTDTHEGIYGHWADQLRQLNVKIEYIPGHRNKVADGLSRTLFDDVECAPTPAVLKAKESLLIQVLSGYGRMEKAVLKSFLSHYLHLNVMRLFQPARLMRHLPSH